MKVYIAGKITGLLNYKTKFNDAEEYLKANGHIVINPAILPCGLGKQEDYLKICKAMIDCCDAVYMLKNYYGSPGALTERDYAVANKKDIWYEGEK